MTQRILNKENIQDHGFVPDTIAADQYVLGANSPVAWEKLMPGGHGWTSFLPIFEAQWRGTFESMNCTVYGTHQCFATILAKRYGNSYNFSERYTGVNAGTTRDGNSPHTVVEEIRSRSGMIVESMLPFSPDIDSWDEYYSPNPMTASLLAAGKTLLDEYDVGHDWVFTDGTVSDKAQKIKDALEYSPVGVSVCAWKERNGMQWKNDNDGDNHWVELYDYVEGEYWMIFDHYEQAHKKLEWHYNFSFAKRYHIKKKDSPAPIEPPKPVPQEDPTKPRPKQKTGLENLIDGIRAFFKNFFKRK